MKGEKRISDLNIETDSFKSIRTLDGLIDALHGNEKKSFDSIMRSAQLTKEDFKEYATWSNNCYTRNCIVDSEEFELILLCWECTQCTPIHDHGGEECWVKIIDGEFQETIYTQDKSGKFNPTKTIHSGPGDISYMNDFKGFHNIKNVSQSKSMSLHLYANPIRNCNVYDKTKQVLVNKNLVYDTFPIGECI